jgi:hypothetical protein
MKKALKIIGIIVLLFLAVLIILPFALKGKIVELVKTEANKNLNAVVNFEDVDLSLIRNFPNLSVGIQSLSVIGLEPFEGDTLAYMDELLLTVNVMSAIRGTEIEIRSIHLEKPVINVLVKADGSANYDIAKESENAEVPADETEGEATTLKIDEYSISDGRLVYDDASLAFYILLDGFDHEGKGNFAEEVFTLYTKSEIEVLDVVYDGVKYLRRAKADLKADIAMDLNQFKFTFMDNELLVNQLNVGFDGWLAMPDEDIDMDITFQSLKSELVTILSLVPADFTQDLEGVDAKGTLSLTGYVKGIYNDNSMPGYGIDLLVENGRVQYPDLPRSIENINIKTNITSPEGNDMDLLSIDVSQFYMEIGKTADFKNTVDATLSLRNPMSDPKIKTKVDADLNLGSFKDVLPLEEDFNLKGLFAAHFELDGAMSDIENQRFDAFKAEGNILLNDMEYSDASMAVRIAEAKADFTPQRLNIAKVVLNYDDINMALDGYLENYVAYALKDTLLEGVFNFTADKIDLNKYMSDDEETTEETDSTAVESDLAIIEVPGNLDVTLNATIGEIIYGDAVLKNMVGQIAVKDHIASLRELDFEALGGNIGMDGYYSTVNPEVPEMSFSYDVRNIDLKGMAETFKTIEQMAPIAKHATGKISSKFNLKTSLDPKMEPIYETMEGGGSLSSENLVLEGGQFLQKLSTTLKSPKLARQEIQDLNLSFTVHEGKVETEPFDIKINSMTANVSGYSSFDQKMDYLMKMKVPRSELGGDFNKMAEGLLSQASSLFGGSMTMGEFINVNVRIHGDIADPTISPSFAGMEGGLDSAKDQVKEAVKEKVEEVIDDAKEKGLEEAKKRADKILADAQVQADRIKKEATDAAKRIREEGESAAKKIEAEAGNNPLAKAATKAAASKLREEANNRAAQVESEGQGRISPGAI